MLLITIAGFVDNGKTQFSKCIVSKPSKLDPTYKEQKYHMTVNANIDYVIDSINNKKYMLTDTPGHNILLSTMLSSMMISDIHVLVISCVHKDSGIDQLDTYSRIYDALNIKKLIIVLSKIDLVERVIYDQIENTIKTHFKNYEAYILPYTNKNPELSIKLFKQYLLKFDEPIDPNYMPILKTYNLNLAGTSFEKIKPLIIGYKSNVVLTDCYIGPIKDGEYKVVNVKIESSVIDENIITAKTNLSPYIGIENNSGLAIYASKFELNKCFIIPFKLEINNTYMLIIKNIVTSFRIRSVKKEDTIILLSKPIPDFLDYPACIIKKVEQKYVFLKTVKLIPCHLK